MFEPRSHVLYFRKENGKTVSYDAWVIGPENKVEGEAYPRLHLAFIPAENELHLVDSNWQDAFVEAWSVPYNDPSAHHYYVGTPKQTLERKIAELQAKIAELSNPSAADLDAAAAEESAKLLTEKPSLVKAKGKK